MSVVATTYIGYGWLLPTLDGCDECVTPFAWIDPSNGEFVLRYNKEAFSDLIDTLKVSFSHYDPFAHNHNHFKFVREMSGSSDHAFLGVLLDYMTDYDGGGMRGSAKKLVALSMQDSVVERNDAGDLSTFMVQKSVGFEHVGSILLQLLRDSQVRKASDVDETSKQQFLSHLENLLTDNDSPELRKKFFNLMVVFFGQPHIIYGTVYA